MQTAIAPKQLITFSPAKKNFWFRITGTNYKDPAALGERVDYSTYYNMPMRKSVVVVLNDNGKKQVLLATCIFCNALSNVFTFIHLFTKQQISISFDRVKEVYIIKAVTEDIANTVEVSN